MDTEATPSKSRVSFGEPSCEQEDHRPKFPALVERPIDEEEAAGGCIKASELYSKGITADVTDLWA